MAERAPPVTPIQRVNAVLAGRPPDRPPFSFWYHFSPDQVAGIGAVRGAKPALWGGVDNLGTLATGTPQQVRDEVADTLRQAGPAPS